MGGRGASSGKGKIVQFPGKSKSMVDKLIMRRVGNTLNFLKRTRSYRVRLIKQIV